MSIKRSFTKYISLNILSMMGLSLYVLADTFFVAQGTGANGLTALNLAIPIFSLVIGTGLMIGMGGATRFSISKSDTIFTRSIFFGAIVSAVYFICGLTLSGQISSVIGAEGEVFEPTRAYLQIILLFAPMFIMNNIINCFVRNDSDPKLSMIAMLCGTFANIVFDYIFVFPLGLGIVGAAIATGFSPLISLCVLSIHFFKKNNSVKFKKCFLTFKAVKDIVTLGISALITELSSGIVILIFNMIILNIEGNIGVAAYGVIANIAIVVNSIFTGIAQGSQPIISRSYGEGRLSDAKKILKYGIITAVVFSAAVYLVTFAFSEPIAKIFDNANNKQLLDIASVGMRLYFISIFFSGINVMCASYFSSIDRPRNGFIISILRGVALIIPTAFLMAYLFGLNGVWLSVAVSEFIVCLLAVVLLKKSNI
ncbi:MULTISPECIES: MATE family efflux transporter [unclassified Ruminococcus]|uniref:MATE family efflux transporter n=1 Tax=unclassified Ruminococcus TaxID=2608920 RepID=UPI00210E7367|nr:MULTISPECIES: MATE family efflux transporter [unclassified Ruminococcus]MCQ4022956.1 MATE family efflux transporter [Ruminococcus sp. zg-924]MCQ4115346.1 MATE family efflux transporter [Ruminococcus sp. zg-921]